MDVVWLIIAIGSILLFSAFSFYVRKINKNKLKSAITCGVFLTIFDFILENIGKITGYWESINSIFFIIYVPVEIIILCFFGGAMWCLMLPEKFDYKFSILFILISINFAVFLESKLVDLNLFKYMNGWTVFHATIVYTLIFIMMHQLFYFFYLQYSRIKK